MKQTMRSQDYANGHDSVNNTYTNRTSVLSFSEFLNFTNKYKRENDSLLEGNMKYNN